MPDLALLRAKNAARWADAKLTRASAFKATAVKAVANKASYLEIEERTGVPWVFIALTHYRECSMNFSLSLAQGDPWDKKSVHVPAGRGPFKSFEDAAVDALANCAPYAARNKDWSIANMITILEQYNGLGYFNRGIPSAYVWAGTNQYVKGKYVEDGKFKPNVVDTQLGCAGLILAMMAIDNTIKFDEAPAAANDVGEVLDAFWLQNSLNKLGASPVLTVDGIIGDKTKAAVKAFQKRKRLKVDGIAGEETIPAIQADLKAVDQAA